MLKGIKITVSLVLVIILLTLTYVLQNKYMPIFSGERPSQNKVAINLENSTSTQGNSSSTDISANLSQEKTPSGKCGYEYFYKTKDGKLTRLNKVIAGKTSPVEGMTYDAFTESVSTWDDTSKKIKEPEATVIAIVYTDTCKEGVSMPTYYYKEGQEVIKKTIDGNSNPVTEIIKGKTFKDIKSTVFSNETAKLMECDFETSVGSAENLFKTRTIAYTPTSVAGGYFYSPEQNAHIIKNGGHTVFIENTNSYADISVMEEDGSMYSPKYDCGDDSWWGTVFLESIDVPNVLIHRFDRGQQSALFFSDLIIVK